MGAGDAQGTGESGASLEQQGTSSQGLSQSHCPTAGQSEAPGQSQLRAAGTASDWGRARPGQEVGTWAGLALGTPGQARQGCGELETGAAASSLGQELRAPGPIREFRSRSALRALAVGWKLLHNWMRN